MVLSHFFSALAPTAHRYFPLSAQELKDAARSASVMQWIMARDVNIILLSSFTEEYKKQHDAGSSGELFGSHVSSAEILRHAYECGDELEEFTEVEEQYNRWERTPILRLIRFKSVLCSWLGRLQREGDFSHGGHKGPLWTVHAGTTCAFATASWGQGRRKGEQDQRQSMCVKARETQRKGGGERE